MIIISAMLTLIREPESYQPSLRRAQTESDPCCQSMSEEITSDEYAALFLMRTG